ncbi:MAG: LCP family protein [Paeniglutamicibacter terrestris]|jgi:LCP family protein required for cell wall assembly|uniref:LCP family protein n=1 Tax=Paeniglutamicibacter terrestris TaxID=2723403 RepID=A0ABX1G9J2_9MICC|nr:LCP family protein [Paeniglutamicibacter terrestris]ASN39626.1 transcriptional regulator [Arthrobacter sp. 7749]NKG22703.1 LCP family protein [Paeniglutamicibacter terrestris]
MTHMNGSYEGASYETPKKKKRTGLMVLLGAVSLVLIALLVAGGYLFSLARSFDNGTEKLPNAFPEESLRPVKAEASKDAVNILLLGNDTRATDQGEENFASLPNGGRSDTMMLVHIPSNREGVYVTSIMRDTWLDIPGHGSAKINAAFAYGGVALAVQTLEGLLDTRIDHVASIDFEGFKGLTDALGGVEINNPIAFKQNLKDGFVFPKGVQTLKGEEALAFVRERYAFKDGDYQRVRNQQLYVKAVMSTLMSKETLTDPAKISETVKQFAPYVAVDETLDAVKVAKLGTTMANVRSSDMHFFTLPNKGTGRSADGQSIVVPDMDVIGSFADALQDDKVGKFVTDNGL